MADLLVSIDEVPVPVYLGESTALAALFAAQAAASAASVADALNLPIYTSTTLPSPTPPRAILISDMANGAGGYGAFAYSDGTRFLTLAASKTYDPVVMAAVHFVSTNGQSLGETHVGGMNETLTQPYAAVMFPYEKSTTTYADLAPAVATNLSLTSGTVAYRDGEAPTFGNLAVGYDLGRTLINIDSLPRIGSNHAHGSTAISQHVKGQTWYNNTLASVTAAKNYATSIGKSLFDMGAGWFQGEQDYALGRTKAQYLADLQGLARDYAADRKAITGQTLDPALFHYITDNKPVNDTTRSGVARAQFQAAVDYFRGTIPSGHTVPAPCIMATPTYFMARQFDATGVHVGADWAFMLGAYVALAQYHCYMKATDLPLNQRFPPIHPINVAIVGGTATITYQMRVPGTSLVFGIANQPNGSGIPAQTNYGFGVYKSGALVSINTPVIVGTNQIQITLASGSFASGDRIGYALDYEPIRMLYATQAGSSAGNVRDNYGDTVRCAKINVPMHNWMAPHDITLGSAGSWSIG